MDREMVFLERIGKTSFLILNRPDVKNAINPELLKILYEKLEEIEKDEETRVVVLKGAGNIFSSGADLKWMLKGKDFKKDGELLFDVLYRIYTFPKVIFCAVQGFAFGGALGFISASDFAYASDDAKFAFPEVKLGIAPAIISPFVFQKVKVGWAKQKFLSGEIFTSREGLEAGLFEKVIKAEKFDEKVKQMAEQIIKGGPEAQREIKKLFLKNKANEILKMKDELCDLLYKLRSSEEGKEGLKAFFEKRSPKW